MQARWLRWRSGPTPATQPSPTATARTATPTGTTGPTATTEPTAMVAAEAVPTCSLRPTPVYYSNCSAMRAAGAAPLQRGAPGYGSHLDRDGDGVASEQ